MTGIYLSEKMALCPWGAVRVAGNSYYAGIKP